MTGVQIFSCGRRRKNSCHYCTRPATVKCGVAGCERPLCGQCARPLGKEDQCRLHLLKP